MDDDDDDEPVADPGAPEPTTVDTDNPMPPPPAGSIYASRDDLLRSANTHARQYGYALSIKKSTASGQKSIIVCTREGRPMNNHHLTDETRVRKGRVSKRSGCKMKIAGNRIRRMRDDGMGEEEVWRLRVIHGEHNHGPDDPKMNPIHRKMADEVKEAIVKGLRRGLKVRKIYDELVERWPDLSATKQDVRNEVGRIRKAQVDLTPADEDVEEIRQRQEDQAQRQRDGARNALPRPNEQDRSVMALLRMEKEALEAEVRTLKEGASRAANAEVNAENARLKSEVETLKKDLDREKKEVEAGKTRLDELRSVVDRYLLQNIGGSKGAQTPPQTQQQQQVQQPQTASPQFGNVGIQSAMQMPNHSQYPSAAVNQGYGAPQPGRGSSRMMGGMGDGWHR